ncbi:uncharacterized protein LOC133034339 [Cannabis sativa]|nr:uncharacterized protein LOC133034339 [Cannabis sativa]
MIVASAIQVASSKDKNPIECDMTFYGVIKEIWELDYISFRIPVFLCDWVRSDNGVKEDEFGFKLVDLNRVGHKSDRFIMASQAKQVFYMSDPIDGRWSVVLTTQPKDYDYQESGGDLYLNDKTFEINPPPIDVAVRDEIISSREDGTLTMDDPGDYDDDFALWGQSIGGESESDPPHPSEGILLEVEYNQWGQCIGDTANELVSQIGLYARRNLPLAYNDWRKVPMEFKNLLWEYIKSMFKLGPEAKHSTLKTAGRRWKDWKAFLTRNLIFKYKDKVPAMLDRPPDAYVSCYKPEDWKEFVAKRCSQEWEKKRKKMQDIRSQNTYNHHAGRGGVKKVEEKLEKELGHQLTIYDRAYLWIRIHTNKNGELDDPAQEVADRIAEIRKQVEEGTILVEGSKDILTLALGTEEHGGRVRGMGGGVTQTQFFKTPRPKRKRVDDNDRMSEVEKRLEESEEHRRRQDELLNKLLQIVQSQSGVAGTSHASGSGVGGASNEPAFAAVTSVLGATPTARASAPPTGRASTTPNARASAPPAPKASAPPAPKASAPPAPKATIPTPPLVAPPATPCAAAPPAPSPVTSDNRLRCDMYVIDPKEKDSVLVVSGYVKLEKADKEGNIIIHGVKKKFDDFKRVFIEKVVEENAILPCPIEHEGFDTVDERKEESFKRSFGSTRARPPINPKGPNKQSVKRYIPPAKTQLLSGLSEIVKNWPAKKSKRYYIKPEVFGGEGQECWISADEVEDVCELHMIGNTVMSLWCSYLQEHTLNLGGLRNTYAFNNPASVSTEAGKLKQRSENLCQRMMGMQPEQWLICPWNSGDHWLTIMIHANTQSVAYLDSTNDFIRTDIMKCIQNAVDMYRIEKNIRNKGPVKINQYTCRQQPDGIQCGYYVMKIIQSFMTVVNPASFLKNHFKLDAPYSNEEINAVRDELAEFVKPLIID